MFGCLFLWLFIVCWCVLLRLVYLCWFVVCLGLFVVCFGVFYYSFICVNVCCVLLRFGLWCSFMFLFLVVLLEVCGLVDVLVNSVVYELHFSCVIIML